MLTDSQQLEFCKTCVKRTFDPNKGIVCSLTDLKPNFKDSCLDYDKDVSHDSFISKMEERHSWMNGSGKWDYDITGKKLIILILKFIMFISGVITFLTNSY